MPIIDYLSFYNGFLVFLKAADFKFIALFLLCFLGMFSLLMLCVRLQSDTTPKFGFGYIFCTFFACGLYFALGYAEHKLIGKAFTTIAYPLLMAGTMFLLLTFLYTAFYYIAKASLTKKEKEDFELEYAPPVKYYARISEVPLKSSKAAEALKEVTKIETQKFKSTLPEEAEQIDFNYVNQLIERLLKHPLTAYDREKVEYLKKSVLLKAGIRVGDEERKRLSALFGDVVKLTAKYA